MKAHEMEMARNRVIRAVEAKYGVSMGEMRRHTRKPSPAILARFEAMYRLRHEVGLSYHRIGQIMNRDHSTVIHGVQRYKKIDCSKAM